MRASVVNQPIDLERLTREVTSPECGATAVFVGTVREQNEGRSVSGIEYSAYVEMAEREMNSIIGEAETRFGVQRVVIEHRIGELGVGDASIAVLVAHRHRGPAMDALRYIVDETKARATIWKLEHYTDGTREWVNAGTGGEQ